MLAVFIYGFKSGVAVCLSLPMPQYDLNICRTRSSWCTCSLRASNRLMINNI